MKNLTTKLGVVSMMLLCCATLNAQTFTVQSGKWSSPSTWSSGIVPDSTLGSITINHKVNLADTVLKVDELILNDTLIIDAGSTLLLSNALTMLPDLQILNGGLKVYGRLVCLDSTTSSGTTASNTFFYDGSTYEHRFFNVAGTPPVATWSTNSNLEITGYRTSKTLNNVLWSQSFGNVIYNCRDQTSSIELAGRLKDIKGNLIIQNTHTSFLRFSLDASNSTVIHIGGNLIVEGKSNVWFSRDATTSVFVDGDFKILSSATANSYLTTTGNCDINVQGNFEMNTSSTLRFSSASASGRGILRVKKSFTFTAGSIDVSGGDGLGTIELNGEAEQSFSSLDEWTAGVNLLISNVVGVQAKPNSKVEGNITIASGGKLTLPASNFILHGDLTVQNGGSIQANKGALDLAGSINQSVSLSGDTLHNINVNKPSATSVTFTSAANLSGMLAITSTHTTINSNGNLILLSKSDDGNADASLHTLPIGSSIVGNVTVQRFMNGEGRIYRYISSPVSNASVDSLMDDFPITGTFDNPSTGQGIRASSPSFFYYDETLPDSDGWISYPSTGLASENILEAGRGYSAFIREALHATTWDVTGTINQGDINLPVTFTDTSTPANDGWNLIGNPYPSSINWSVASGWTKTNVDNGIAIRDNSTGGFLYWDGEVGSLGNGRIAKGQSFWIKTNAHNPQLIVKETAKSAASTNFYRQKISEPDYVEISVQINDHQDHAYLRRRDHASNTYDSLDAVKFTNDFINLAFDADVPLAISAIQELDCSKPYVLNLYFARNSTGDFARSPIGEYTLSADAFGIFRGSSINLHDRFTHQDFDLTSSPYTFSITEDSASFRSERFALSFSAPQFNDTTPVFSDSVLCDTSIPYKMTLKNIQQHAHYKIHVNNRLVQSLFSQDKDTLSAEIDSKELNSGFNKVRVSATNVCHTKQIEDFRVWKQDRAAPALSSKIVCNTDTSTLYIQNTKEAVAFHWYDHSNTLLAQTQDSSFVVMVQKSTTFYASAVYNYECISEPSSVHVDVVRYDVPSIEEDQGILVSNHSDNNQWSLDGEELAGANQSTIKPTTTGNYTLTISYKGCVDSTSYFYIHQNESLQVFPIPFENELNIIAPEDEYILRIEIVNAFGQLVQSILTEQDATMEVINSHDLGWGIYSLQILTTRKQYQTKILKK